MARRPVVMIVASSFLAAACASTGDAGDTGLEVVATTSILGDIASAVVGEEGTVEVLVPLGVDSHEFQPSAQQASLLAGADLVLANGLGLERGLEDLLSATAGDGVPVLEIAPLVAPLPFPARQGEDGEGTGAEHGELDPHFWMDPLRIGDAADALAAELLTLEPGGSWLERATAYSEDMTAADARIEDTLGQIAEQDRKLVTNHEAFAYFAERYGFEILGVVIPGGSTLAEPSSAEIAALVEVMREEGVTVIFAETTQPTTLAEAVAAELGEAVEVVELYTESLGEPGSAAATLEGMLLTNAERIAVALS